MTSRNIISRWKRRSTGRKPETFLITGAHVIVGDGSEIAQADVLIADSRIVQVSEGPLKDRNARTIDGRGKTLMPGLIDAHAHLDLLTTRNALHSRLRARFGLPKAMHKLLEHGITTVRCMGDPPRSALRLRDRARRGTIIAPHLLVAGPVLTAPGGHPAVTVAADNPWLRRHLAVELDDTRTARDTVRQLHAQGVDLIKLVYQGGHYGESGTALGKLPEPVMTAIIAEAHQLGLPVAAHTHHQEDVEVLLSAGIDSIEHGILEVDISGSATLKAWGQSGTLLVPTLYISTLVRGWKGADLHEFASRNLLRCYQAGVRIIAGTDSMIGALPAHAMHEELRLMTAAGLPTQAVLRSATEQAARSIGVEDRGTVKTGQVADLVLLNSNPVERIENIGDTAMVFSEGRLVHEVVAPPAPELPQYTPPAVRSLTYTDDTEATVDRSAVLNYDTTRFPEDAIREIRYTDPIDDTVIRTERVTSATDLVTTEWEYSLPGEDTELTATRTGPTVVLSGRLQGESVKRVYPLRGRTWMQTFLFDASTFIMSSEATLEFVAIGTSGRGALAMTDFEIAKIGRKKASGNERVSTRLVIPQWRRFWASMCEYDATSGELLEQHIRGKDTKRLQLREENVG